jgi:hypothetical protein
VKPSHSRTHANLDCQPAALDSASKLDSTQHSTRRRALQCRYTNLLQSVKVRYFPGRQKSPRVSTRSIRICPSHSLAIRLLATTDDTTSPTLLFGWLNQFSGPVRHFVAQTRPSECCATAWQLPKVTFLEDLSFSSLNAKRRLFTASQHQSPWIIRRPPVESTAILFYLD